MELGEYVEPAMVCSSLGLQNIYTIEHLREISTVCIRTQVSEMGTEWDEMLIDYLNDTKECSAVYFSKKEKDNLRLLNEYERLRQSLMKEYGDGEESFSENASSMSCLWEDKDTVLRLIITNSGENKGFSLLLAFSDKVQTE